MAKNMGLPGIDISFKEQGISRIGRSERGIVALLLQDKKVEGTFDVYNIGQIPKELSEKNKEQVELALKGYVRSPRKVIVVVVKSDAAKVTLDIASPAFKELETLRWDFFTVPFIEKEDAEKVATWIKNQNDNYKKRCQAILPNIKADYEKIINYTIEEVRSGEKTYKTNEYLSRIAGLIAGTPMQIAVTYAPLPELDYCTVYNKEELTDKIGQGEFVLMNDGEKIKVARGINSLTTTNEIKGDSFRKIKIISIMDAMADDIEQTAEDSYLGKYANTYDNKCLLMSAILGYMEVLENDSLLQPKMSSISIDLEAQKAFLDSMGYKTADGRTPDEMDLSEIKEADTKDKVFIEAKCKILDAIEEIYLPITI